MSWLWRFVAGVTLRQGLIAGAVAIALGAGAWTVRWHYAEVREGKQDTRDSMALAAKAMEPAQRAAVTITRWRTDTMWLRAKASGEAATRQADRVDSAAAAVPERVLDAEPTVVVLKAEAKALGDSARTLTLAVIELRGDIITERAANDSLQHTIDVIAITANDELFKERARPKRTWKSNTALVVTGAALLKLGEFTINALRKD